MTFFRDLDEYHEFELENEIRYRQNLRRQGLCDYCRRGGDTSPCKFPERHRIAFAKTMRRAVLTDLYPDALFPLEQFPEHRATLAPDTEDVWDET